MMQGLYTGAATLSSFEKQHEAITANLANISTPGYRRRVQAMVSQRLGSRTMGMADVQTPRFSLKVDFTPADTVHTGRLMDVAIGGGPKKDGNAFLALRSDSGEEFYSRAGRLNMDEGGKLTHATSGYSLVNPNGAPIVLNPLGGKIAIDDRGSIIQGGQPVGQLKIVRFSNLAGLGPADRGLFQPEAGNSVESAVGEVKVRQGYLENSNAQAMDEMVKMIMNYRSYEATHRIMRQMDQSLQKLIQKTAL